LATPQSKCLQFLKKIFFLSFVYQSYLWSSHGLSLQFNPFPHLEADLHVRMKKIDDTTFHIQLLRHSKLL
jgi:hypothetical protein